MFIWFDFFHKRIVFLTFWIRVGFFGLYQTLRSYTRECYFYCVSLTRSSSDLINSIVSKEIIKRKAGLKCNSLIRYMIKFYFIFFWLIRLPFMLLFNASCSKVINETFNSIVLWLFDWIWLRFSSVTAITFSNVTDNTREVNANVQSLNYIMCCEF